MRDKVDSRYAQYITSSEKETLLSLLSSAEDWLYSEEGEDATKSAYVERLNGSKAKGDPVVLRYKESEDRPKAAASLRESADLYLSQAQSGDEKYSHIDEAEKNKVVSIALSGYWVRADRIY
jgi:heat shock protein 4